MDTLKTYLQAQRGRIRDLAKTIGKAPAYVSQMAHGRRPVPEGLAHDISRLTGVPLWSLRPNDWHRIWPELAGAKGAPKPPVINKPARLTVNRKTELA